MNGKQHEISKYRYVSIYRGIYIVPKENNICANIVVHNNNMILMCRENIRATKRQRQIYCA